MCVMRMKSLWSRIWTARRNVETLIYRTFVLLLYPKLGTSVPFFHLTS